MVEKCHANGIDFILREPQRDFKGLEGLTRPDRYVRDGWRG